MNRIARAIAQRAERLAELVRKGPQGQPLVRAALGLAHTKDDGSSLVFADPNAGVADLDTSGMIAWAVISTVVEDRDGDIVEPMGINLSHYRDNPIVLFNHDQNCPVGVSEDDAGKLLVKLERTRALAGCRFTTATEKSEQTFALVADGIIRATSIGFLATKAKPMPASKAHEGREGKGNGHGWHFQEVTLLEWSWTAIGSNPEAIRLTLDRGRILGRPIVPSVRKSLEAYAPPAPVYARGSAVAKGREWHEEDHARASDGRFGSTPGEHGGGGSKPKESPPHKWEPGTLYALSDRVGVAEGTLSLLSRALKKEDEKLLARARRDIAEDLEGSPSKDGFTVDDIVGFVHDGVIPADKPAREPSKRPSEEPAEEKPVTPPAAAPELSPEKIQEGIGVKAERWRGMLARANLLPKRREGVLEFWSRVEDGENPFEVAMDIHFRVFDGKHEDLLAESLDSAAQVFGGKDELAAHDPEAHARANEVFEEHLRRRTGKSYRRKDALSLLADPVAPNQGDPFEERDPSPPAPVYARGSAVEKGEWHEEDHPRADDGKFGSGGGGGADAPTGGGAKPAQPPYVRREKPTEPIVFTEPIVGPSGAKLLSYEWKYTEEEEFDEAAEEVVVRRISNWEEAERNIETGRGVVHHFHIETAEGDKHIVSLETALKMLGYAGKGEGKPVRALASSVKTLAKLRMELQIGQARKDLFDAAMKEAREHVEEMELPTITREPKQSGVGVWWLMGDVRVGDFSSGDTIPAERRRLLEETWRGKRIAEIVPAEVRQLNEGGMLGERIRGLQKRIAKAEEKVQDVASEASAGAKSLGFLWERKDALSLLADPVVPNQGDPFEERDPSPPANGNERIQAVVFPKELYPDADQCAHWCAEHNFDPSIREEDDEFWIFVQFQPSALVGGSERLEPLEGEHVYGIVGEMQEEVELNPDDQDLVDPDEEEEDEEEQDEELERGKNMSRTTPRRKGDYPYATPERSGTGTTVPGHIKKVPHGVAMLRGLKAWHDEHSPMQEHPESVKLCKEVGKMARRLGRKAYGEHDHGWIDEMPEEDDLDEPDMEEEIDDPNAIDDDAGMDEDMEEKADDVMSEGSGEDGGALVEEEMEEEGEDEDEEEEELDEETEKAIRAEIVTLKNIILQATGQVA